jgi:hypothetical protein
MDGPVLPTADNIGGTASAQHSTAHPLNDKFIMRMTTPSTNHRVRV